MNAKKSKLDCDDLVTIIIENLPGCLEDSAVERFLEENQIKPVTFRLNYRTRKAYIDVTEDEKKKVLALDQTEVLGSKITVSLDKEVPDTNAKTIFVTRIPKDMTKDSLLSVFHGAIDARIPVNRGTSQNKGFGFVEFATETDASCWYARAKDGIDVDGVELRVDYSHKKRSEDVVVSVLLRNLPKGLDGSSFLEFLQEHKIKPSACNPNYGRRKVFIEVTEDEKKELLALHETEFLGSKISVSVVGKKLLHPVKKSTFVTGISEDMSKDSLSNFDGAINAKLLKFSNTGNNMGSGYVDFKPENHTASFYANANDEIDADGDDLDLPYLRKENWKAREKEDQFRKSLHIGGITEYMTEGSLLAKFDRAISATIPRNGKTGKNRSYGYVHFKTERDAVSCFERAKDGIDVNGVILKVRYSSSQKDVGEDKLKKSVYIQGITENMTEDSLVAKFHGAVDARIPRNKNTGKNQSYGIVEFNSVSNAVSFCERAKDGIYVDGVDLNVRSALKKRDRRELLLDQAKKSIFVTGISEDMSKDSLLSLFDGAINAKLLKFSNTGKNMGSGYVDFKSENDAESFYKKTNGKIDANGVNLDLQYPREKNRNSSDKEDQFKKSFCVRGITESITEDSLLAKFRGAVDARIFRNMNSRKNKSFAYVNFESEDDAVSCYKRTKYGVEVDGVTLTVRYSSNNKHRENGSRGGRGSFLGSRRCY